jgi:hypothetical protein
LIISNLKDVGITTLSPLNIKPFCTVSSSRTSKYIIADGGTSYFLFGPNDNESDIEGVNMLSDLPISEQRISEIQQYTLNDEQMQELKEVIQNGWPNRKYDVPPSAISTPTFNHGRLGIS